MPWVWLFIAGLMETAWAIGLNYSDGLRRPLPTALTIAAIAVSMCLLSFAVRTLPIGTAYAVWVGIGAAGTMLVEIALLGEPISIPRLAFLGLLLIAIVGLKATAH
jgi:quaternary ammonium compound-resistance protein SugE